MSREQALAVVECIAAYNEGDWDRAVTIFAPDVEWRDSAEHPDRRAVVGPAAVMEHLRARLDVLPSTFHVDRVVDRGDGVVGLGQLRAGGISSEGEIRTPFALLFTFGTDGAIVRVEEFRNHAEALKAAGVEE